MGKVLVLGNDMRAFLTVIRSLGRGGHAVHVAWCPKDAPALNSKYIKKVHQLAPYSNSDDSWMFQMIKLFQNEKFDLVIPCRDDSILPMQKHRNELERHTRVYLLNERSFEYGFDKQRMDELACSLGINLPKERIVHNLSEAYRSFNEFGSPLVVKPFSSFTLDDLNNKQFVLKIYHKEKIQTCIPAMLQKGRLLVQENFIGIGMGVSVLALRGEILAVFQHERVHEPLFGGGSSYRKSVSLNTELFKATSILISKLNYTGVAMMEFKQNPKNGSWVFIEINPRFWGSLPLAVASGVDFPLYLYQMLVEGKRMFPERYRRGIYCRNLINDIRWNWENFKANRSDPTLMTKPLPLVAGEVFNILTGRERIDSFTFDDIIPGFAEFAEFAPMIRVLRAKLDTKILENRLSMGLHAAHAKHRFKKAKCILLISKANVCRSPFAYYYLANKCDKNKSFSSAGYCQKADRSYSRLTREVAEEFGINMHRHRYQIVARDMVKCADIIFVFDGEDYITMMERFSGIRNKLFLLGSLEGSSPPVIQNAAGLNVEAIRVIYKRITRLIDVLASD